MDQQRRGLRPRGPDRDDRARRGLRLVLAVVLITLLAGVPDRSSATPRQEAAEPGGGRPAAPTALPAPAAGAGTWVTLVTGDRVLVGPPAQSEPGTSGVHVEPGPGRDGVGYRTYTQGGDTYVVPLDAQPLLDAGRLDEQLFDVSALVRFGYDDRSRPDLPLIVAGRSEQQAEEAVTEALSDADADARDSGAPIVTRSLASVDAVAVRQDKAEATALWEAFTGAGGSASAGASPEARADTELDAGLTRVWLDGRVQAILDQSVPQIGAPAAWEGGLTGEGVEVAVLDTGVDPDHPDLSDAVAAAQDFTEEDGEDTSDDGNGHGTHVASIVTGNGQASGGRYAGVAPDARLLVGKVLYDSGGGYDSEVVAGMEWAAGQGASVVNMSLGKAGWAGDGTDLLDQAIDRLTQETDTLFVVAAGNDGPDPGVVNSPAAANAALAVGAVDDQDRIAEFSSRGPRPRRPAVKPEITAPGVEIVAARAAGTGLGSPVDGSYTAVSGTSMAAPHVAGAAAILAGQHPDWAAEQLKAALMGSAAPQDDATVYDEGAGRVDLARAVTQPVYATPASVHTGVARWPHGDDEPAVAPITYHNDADSPLTLDLTVDVRDPAGAAAASGMATVSPAQLTVPAGGEATASLTVDTTVAGPDGHYGGLVTATGTIAGGQPVAVQTPVGFTKEVESYDVTVQALDRDGGAPDVYGGRVAGVDGEGQHALGPEPVVRIPKGTYYLESFVQTVTGPDSSDLTVIVEPTYTVNGDTTLVLDARQGVPVRLGARDRPEAVLVDHGLAVGFHRRTADGVSGWDLSPRPGDTLFIRPSDTAAPAGEFTFRVSSLLARPDGNGGFDGSPYMYTLKRIEDGVVPADLEQSIPDRALAAVDRTYAVASDSATGTVDGFLDVALPATVTTYRTPGVAWGAVWDGDFTDDPATNIHRSFTRTWTVGRHRERWNAAPFGPPDLAVAPFVTRAQDQLTVQLPLFSDQTPNHVGDSLTDTAATTLERDGEVIGEAPAAGFGEFQLPPDEGTYRLTARATRSTSHLSTRVEGTWTFRSGPVDGAAGAVPVPMIGVRFAPLLDDHNRSPAGRDFTIPVHIVRQTGDGTGPVDTLTVEVSYDDGETWQAARLIGRGDDRVAHVRHPSGDGHVSLRARATDTSGNAVEQTIIHAYALTG